LFRPARSWWKWQRPIQPAAGLDGVGGDDDDEFAVPTVTRRLAKHSRRRSTARAERVFCAGDFAGAGIAPSPARICARNNGAKRASRSGSLQLAERGVEMRGDVFPGVRLRSTAARQVGSAGKQFIHAAASCRGRGGEPRSEVCAACSEPCDATNPKDRAIYELGGVSRQRNEHPLSHFLSEVRTATIRNAGGINEIQVAARQFGERRVGAMFSVGGSSWSRSGRSLHQW